MVNVTDVEKFRVCLEKFSGELLWYRDFSLGYVIRNCFVLGV